MKAVILDGALVNPGDNPWTPLEELSGLDELTVHEHTEPEQLLERAAGADILLTNKTPLTASHVAALDSLKFVSVLATGYDVLAMDALNQRGIPVSNVPGYSGMAVAQHAFALLLELTNKVAEHAAATAAGEWTGRNFSFWKQAPRELDGATLGIVGLGDLGRGMAKLGHAFGMTVIAYAPRPKNPLPYPGFAFVDLPELFATADVISLHCPQTPENKEFVNAELLGRVKPGALFINTARGTLVNEADLLEALRSGKLGGAGLDVLAVEPPPAGHPLLNAPNCIVTPHMAWASQAARQRLTQITAGNIRAFLRGAPRNLVSAATAA